jgi:hypothetical protein
LHYSIFNKHFLYTICLQHLGRLSHKRLTLYWVSVKLPSATSIPIPDNGVFTLPVATAPSPPPAAVVAVKVKTSKIIAILRN